MHPIQLLLPYGVHLPKKLQILFQFSFLFVLFLFSFFFFFFSKMSVKCHCLSIIHLTAPLRGWWQGCPILNFMPSLSLISKCLLRLWLSLVALPPCTLVSLWLSVPPPPLPALWLLHSITGKKKQTVRLVLQLKKVPRRNVFWFSSLEFKGKGFCLCFSFIPSEELRSWEEGGQYSYSHESL